MNWAVHAGVGSRRFLAQPYPLMMQENPSSGEERVVSGEPGSCIDALEVVLIHSWGVSLDLRRGVAIEHV